MNNFDNSFIDITKSILNVLNIVLDVGGKNNSMRTISFLISRTNLIVNVTNSTFLNFYSQNGGAIANLNTVLILQFNVFYSNKAQNGGALYTRNSNLTITDNYFLSNFANNGGAIYFANDQNLVSLNISNNNFTNNFAEKGGGAFFTVYTVPFDLSNSYIGNKAEYGNNFASPPIMLKFKSENSTEIYSLNHYLISSTIPFDLEFYLLDIYHNVINASLSGKAIMQLSNPATYKNLNFINSSTNIIQLFGQLLSDYSTGKFIFKKIALNFKPNSVIFLSISSDQIQNFVQGSFIYDFPNYMDSFNNYYYLLMVNSSDCPIGEFFFF